ncbi:MAG: nucleotidyltransferase domain-containing protein [Armatimonadetes bacterium]|nr:nucleotidyltransferase domain-containing protein [Armatimonadota bacterium]
MSSISSFCTAHGRRALRGSDSDVDIAVRTRRRDYDKVSPKRQFDWLLNVMDEINEAIDYPESCDVRLSNASDVVFLANVARYGIPLYEESPDTFAVFQTTANDRYRAEEPERRLLRDRQREYLYGRPKTVYYSEETALPTEKHR